MKQFELAKVDLPTYFHACKKDDRELPTMEECWTLATRRTRGSCSLGRCLRLEAVDYRSAKRSLGFERANVIGWKLRF